MMKRKVLATALSLAMVAVYAHAGRTGKTGCSFRSY